MAGVGVVRGRVRPWLVGVVSAAVIGSGLSVSAIQSAVADPVVPASAAPLSEGEAMARAEQLGAPVEATELTTETMRVMADPASNQMVAEISPFPVRVREDDGSWADVDTSLEREADGSTTTSVTPVDISTGVGREPLVTLDSDGYKLDLTWADTLPAPVVDGNIAVYPNVLPDVDLAVESGALGIRQYFIVRTRAAAADPRLGHLRLGYRAPGLTLHTEDGGFIASNASGQTIFTGPQLRMWETSVPTAGTPASVSLAAVRALEVETTESAKVGLQVTSDALILTPDQQFLADASTQFPVVIDPTVSRERSVWGMVWSDGQEFWNSSSENARVGYDGWQGNKKARSFYRFADMDVMAGAEIKSAVFAHKQVHSTRGCDVSSGVPGVELWYTGGISSSLTWSNQPEWRKKLATATVAHGNSQQCPGYTRTEWNATAGVQIITDEGWSTFTVGLKSADEGDKFGWRQFDNDGTYPVLSVTYNRTPSMPGAVTLDEWVDYKGTKFLSDVSPTQRVKVVDPDGGSVRAKFIINPDDAAAATVERFSPYVTSGGTAVLAETSGALKNGQRYYLSARANDGSRESASGAGTYVTVDTAAPTAPVITGPVNNPQVGQTVSFTFDSASTDTARYVWGWNTDTPATSVEPASLGAAVSGSLTIPQFGPHFVTAYAVDRAGNRSSLTRFEFKVDGTLPARRYRLDGTGSDTRTGTAPAQSGVDLTVPASGVTWSDGRDARYVDGEMKDCTDKAVLFTPSGTVKNLVSSADPADNSKHFSMSAWVKPASLSTTTLADGQEAVAVSMFSAQNTAFSLGLRKPNTSSGPVWTLMVDADTTVGGRTVVASTVAATTEWTHLVAVWNPAAKTAQLYVNGEKAAETTLAAAPFNASQLMIGGAPIGTANAVWDGVVDEVLLFVGVLDSTQALKVTQTERDPASC